jgi:hypothetical protein
MTMSHLPALSAAVNTYPLIGDWPLIVKVYVRIVPLTSNAGPGAVDANIAANIANK